MALIDAIWKKLPFRKAIQWFLKKVVVPTERWDDLQREQHDHAFVIAGLQNAQILDRFKGKVREFIEEGKTLEDFRKEFEAIATETGWEYNGSPSWRSKIIALTNARTSYSAGRFQQMEEPELKAARPFREYRHGGSAEPRQKHISVPPFGWNGLILRADDPWWNAHFPPNGFGCFPEGTLVATPNGWKRIEAIKQGDLVIGGSGDIKPVTAKHTRPYSGELVGVTIENGFTDFLTPNHRVLTMRGWIRADALKLEDVLIQITQASSVDQVVGNVDEPDAMLSDSLMALPGKWNAAGVEAFNPNIQSRYIDIDPPPINVEIMSGLQAKGFNVIDNGLLNSGWSRFSVRMTSWMKSMTGDFGDSHLGFDFGPSSRGAGLKFLRGNSNPFTVLLGFAKSVVPTFGGLFKGKSPGKFRGFLTAIASINPLKSNGLAARSSLNTTVIDKPGKGSEVDLPKFADFIGKHGLVNISAFDSLADRAAFKFLNLLNRFPVWTFARAILNSVGLQKSDNGTIGNVPELFKVNNIQHLFDIPQPEGFVDGAPLDRFNSLDDFLTWATSHAILHRICKIERIPYSNSVHNLSVLGDNSYCIRIAAVHNCSCKVFSLSERDLERLGKRVNQAPQDGFYRSVDRKTGESRLVPNGIDPGWDYTPGRSPEQERERIYRDILGRLSPELREQVERNPKLFGNPLERKIARNREIFDQAGEEFDKNFFDDQSGGFVLIHQAHNKGSGFGSERFVAETLARQGKKVVLLDESEAVAGKRPDADVDGEIWDFKSLTSDARSFANRVQAGIKQALRQEATQVAYHIDRDDFDLGEIKRGVKRAFDLDVEAKVVSVSLIFNDGTVQILTRENQS